MTKCQQILHNILEDEFKFTVFDDYPLVFSSGKAYYIDCVVMGKGISMLGFEADGKFTHTFKKKDKARDEEILRIYGIPVLRVSDKLLMTKKQRVKAIKMIQEFIDDHKK